VICLTSGNKYLFETIKQNLHNSRRRVQINKSRRKTGDSQRTLHNVDI